MKKTNSLLQQSAVRASCVAGGLLLIPLLGRWPWGVFDFVVMGALIFGTTYMIDQALRTVDQKYRVWTVLAILGVFFLIWTELAVGLVSQVLTGELWIFQYLQ